MSGLIFFKKELKAIFKTYRFWLLPLIFIVFGILSPVTAKLSPALIKSFVQSIPGVKFKIPPPKAADSYVQWLKNLSQLGVLALIFMSMGLVSEEKLRGTLALVVTKPVSRASIIFSKFFAQLILVAFSLFAGAAACLLYTFLIFSQAPVLILFSSTTAFFLLYLLVLALTILFSTVFRQPIGSGGFSLLCYFGISVLGSLGYGFDKYSPGALSNFAYRFIAETTGFSNAGWTAAVTLGISLLAIAAAAIVLQRQEI